MDATDGTVRNIVEKVVRNLPDTSTSCDVCSFCGDCVEQNAETVDRILDAGAERVGSALGTIPRDKSITSKIDHTLLNPDASKEDVQKLCEEAIDYGFASVCVNPFWVDCCANWLRETPVKTCTVIGFPLGATKPDVKAYEARQSQQDGAEELDMVMNIGALKSGNIECVKEDIQTVRAVCEPGTILKVIIETCLLTDEEKVKACVAAKVAGADFVKTSTGFSEGGATVEDVALMRKVVGKTMGVKASGGVGDIEKAEDMIGAGATRIGASGSVKIAEGEGSSSDSGY